MGKLNLTAKRVKRLLKEPGRHRDGDVRGLLLCVVGKRNANWVLRYERHGKEHMLGLGSAREVPLKLAREKARAARLQLSDGIDPLAAKRAAKATAKLAAQRELSFEAAAKAYDDQHQSKWRNRKAAAQFLSSLKAYVFPPIGTLRVGQIDTPAVLRVLEQPVEAQKGYPGGPFWQSRPETAGRVRGRIEAVLDWATVRGYRSGDNPARWKGHLDQVLPARSETAPTNHHAALPFAQLPEFLVALRAREGVAARALEFSILTAARTGEVIGTTWDEIDLKAGVWTVSAARTKASREHRVPLAPRAIEILKALPHERGNPHAFIGPRNAALSNMAMAATLRRMDYGNYTVHGFRSTFRDWAAERTNYPNHVVEMALAHVIGNAVEAAYRRGDLFDKRRKLMEAWAGYCGSKPIKTGEVVALRAAT